MRTAIIAVLCLGLVVTPGLAADHAPSIMFAPLLNGIVLQPGDGSFSLKGMWATFLPEVDVPPGSEYAYAPDHDNELWAILARTGDEPTELCRFSFYVKPMDDPFWFISHYHLTGLPDGENLGYAGQVRLDPGDYRLDFHLAGGRFWSFPFSVSMIEDDDPFGGGDRYYIDGDWRDWAYIHIPDADPESMLYWKAWLRHKGAETEKQVEIRIGLMRESENNKLIAVNRPNVTHRLAPYWERIEWPLIEPDANGALRYGKDLLVDGTYVLKMVVADEPYGLWRFEVNDGKLVPTGRTVRGEADPLTFIEGGVDAFWYERAE